MNQPIKLTDRPTPETDAACEEIQLEDGYPHRTYNALCVFSKHARRLEQQRDSAVEALEFYAARRHDLEATNDDDRNDNGELGLTARATLAAIKEPK